MATTPAVGNGPIEYTDPDTGQLTLVPLSALSFNGALNVKPPYDTTPAPLKSWLSYLASANIKAIQPGVAPKTVAMILTAARPGSSGNNILVQFDNFTLDPNVANITFRVTVTETDIYPNLEPSTIKAVLGTETIPGSQPGLVHLLDSDNPVLPDPGPYPLDANPGPPAKASKLVLQGVNTAFTVEAYKEGADGSLITVTISNSNASTGTFMLTAQWQKKVESVTLATIPQQLADLAYLIKVKPADNGAYALPAPTSLLLNGGTDGSSPSTASATIYTT